MKQAPHIRTSKRGRKFRAGRGFPKKNVRRASQSLRNKIKKKINVEGPHKWEIIKIMAKDPLLYQEYINQKSPNIIVEPNFKGTSNIWAKAFPNKNIIRMDKRLFEEPLYEEQSDTIYPFKQSLQSDLPLNPRETITHELQHFRYPDPMEPNNIKKSLAGAFKDQKEKEFEFNKLPEDMADMRSFIDIRKLKKPDYKIKKDIMDSFTKGFILGDEV